MSQILAFTILLTILYIGDIVATRTKAWIPSVFVCAVLFLAGYWTFFPKDIVALSGMPKAVAILSMYLLVTNMGTLLSVKELIRQWKTILISLAGICGICALGFSVGLLLFDKNTVIVGIPPLVGGVVSSLIMSEGAAEAGLVSLSVFAIILYVMQGFAGYPITAYMLKREGRRVLKQYRAGEWNESTALNESDAKELQEAAMPRLFHRVPTPYNTDYFKFLRLGIVALLAQLASNAAEHYMGIKISPFVLCLLFGVFASSCGFLERHPLQKANGFGFTVMALMLFIFDTLNHATPDMLLGLVAPILVLIGCAVVGMLITSFIIGKVLGVSTEMAYAISLTALYGFPADYIITVEAVNALTTDSKERQILTDHMLGSMLVGGFVSVTIVSVVLAGILVNHITPNVIQ